MINFPLPASLFLIEICLPAFCHRGSWESNFNKKLYNHTEEVERAILIRNQEAGTQILIRNQEVDTNFSQKSGRLIINKKLGSGDTKINQT